MLPSNTDVLLQPYERKTENRNKSDYFRSYLSMVNIKQAQKSLTAAISLKRMEQITNINFKIQTSSPQFNIKL